MIAVFHSILPVFLIVALGWILRRYEIVPESQWEGIELLGFWVLFPLLLFHALFNINLDALTVDSLMLAYLLALTGLLLLLFLAYLGRRTLGIDDAAYSSVFQTTSRWNGFIALAIMDNYAGSGGLAVVALIMAITVVPLNVINILVLAHTAAGKPAGWGSTLATTARNPIIWGALAGLLCNLANVPVYGPMLESVELIAQAGLGIGLLTVGAGLRIRSIFQPRREMWFGVVGKMLLFPLMVGTACLAFGINGIELTAAVACASVPTAMNGYIMARKMGGDAPLYATTSAVQALLGLATIPVFLWISTHLG
jgi:predicted permease